MITTTKGLMDEANLRKVLLTVDNDNERTEAVEYWDGTELVHRSVHVQLKQVGLVAEALATSLN